MVLKVAPRAVLKVALMAPDDEQGRTGPASTTLPRTHCSRTSKKRWKREPSSQGSQHQHCSRHCGSACTCTIYGSSCHWLCSYIGQVRRPPSCSGWIGCRRNVESAWHWHAVAWSHAPDGLVCVLGHRHLSHKSQGLWRWETQRHDTPDQQQDFDLVTLLGRDRGEIAGLSIARRRRARRRRAFWSCAPTPGALLPPREHGFSRAATPVPARTRRAGRKSGRCAPGRARRLGCSA